MGVTLGNFSRVRSSAADLTDSSAPLRKMMRQIAGSFAESYEKARLVAKLKAGL
jgi:hypothetical protein